MCTHCRHQLGPIDLIPVLSWVGLGGRCRYCHKIISWQYPLTELTMGLVFGLSYAAWPYGLSSGSEIVQFVSWLAIVVLLVAMALYDIKWMILPDKLMWPTLLLALISLSLAVQINGGIDLLSNRLAALAVGTGFFGGLYLYSHGRWIGFGDVKLSIVMALVLGLGKTIVAMALAFYGAVLFVLPLLALKRLKPKQAVPFGPFLIAGTIASNLYGQDLIDWYEATFIHLS